MVNKRNLHKTQFVNLLVKKVCIQDITLVRPPILMLVCEDYLMKLKYILLTPYYFYNIQKIPLTLEKFKRKKGINYLKAIKYFSYKKFFKKIS